jgi:hypothetical protein
MGAIHGRAVLTEEEVGPARAIGLPVIEGSEDRVFALPCPKLSGTICTIFGERLMFMPSAFLAILMGMAAARLLRRNADAPPKQWHRPAVLAATALLVVLGSIRTIAYARLWNDRFGFYLAAAEAQPRSLRIQTLLFREYALAKNWPAARAVAERCREQVPQWWESWVMCAEAEEYAVIFRSIGSRSTIASCMSGARSLPMRPCTTSRSCV